MLLNACFARTAARSTSLLALALTLFTVPASAQVPPLPRAVAPILSLSSGTYSSPQSVSMSDTTPGAVIYYSTNGAYPGTVYSTPITVSSSEIVVAVAIAPGYTNSHLTSARYFISSSLTGWAYTVAGNGDPGYSGDGAQATLAQLSLPHATAIDGFGNIYIADTGNNVIRRVDAQTGVITTIAGTGVPGHSGDGGPATSAQLNAPQMIAIDSSGNVYFAGAAEPTRTSNFVVRKIAAGTGILTIYAGGGGGAENGPATAAFLNQPSALATDTQGNLYIDEYNLILKVTASTGIMSTVAGGGAVYGDNGPATNAFFASFGVTVDNSGNIYIADYIYNSVRKVTATTGIITTVAGGPSATAIYGDGGLATAARLNLPYAVAVDQTGNVYIADSLDYAIRKITAATGIISTYAGDWQYGSAGGDGDPSTSVGVSFVTNLATDNAGNLFYADTSDRVRKLTVPTPPPASTTTPPLFSLSAGTYASPQAVTVSDSAPGASVYLSLSSNPPDTFWGGYFGPINLVGSATITAVAVAPGFLPSVPVQQAYTITSPPTSLISTVAGVGYFGSSPSGIIATSALLGNPEATAVDQAGNLYIAELGDDVVRMVSATTSVETIVAGTGTQGYNGDGIAANSAELNEPHGIAVDKAGNLYIADWYNARIRKVAAGTGLISTVAGPGVSGTLGDGGPATSAYIGDPLSVALDATGNIYIADPSNRVRMVSAATGIITTIAGTGTASFSGDGGLATAATLNDPAAVALDSAGNLFISEYSNPRIRKVDAKTGIITTVAGNGIQGSSKEGSLATQTSIDLELGSLAVDAAGNLFFSNYPNSIARVDSLTGILTTVAGNHYEGISGNGGDARIASLGAPQGVSLDTNGNPYIAEYDGGVRKVTFSGSAPSPYFSLAGGTYNTPQTLTLTAAQGATIYYTYTANGTKPTTASPVYTGPITINTTGTVEAIAVVPGFTQSPIASKSYTYVSLPPAAAPYFNLAGGTYHSPVLLTLTDPTPSATIHYTTNGTTPTAASTLYSSPITIASTETIEAVAIATGYSLSSPASKSYVYVAYPPATAPSFSLAGGTYNTPQSLTLTDTTPSATIYYTTNGTTPTTSSTVYKGTITIASTETVEAAAIATGYALSPVSSKAYTYSPLPLAAAPYFSLAGGHYTTPQMLTLTDATPGAAIYYTTSGTIPTTSSTRYTGPLTISTSETVIAIAAATGYTNSNPASKAYTIP